jgi:hypothetical protein
MRRAQAMASDPLPCTGRDDHEAIGLLIEITFTATFTQRCFHPVSGNH